MSTDYFSDREGHRRPRIREEVDRRIWRGLKAYIETELKKDSFAYEFPTMCEDGIEICGTDRSAFAAAVEADIPDLDWPLPEDIPDQSAVFDLLEFCYQRIVDAERKYWHQYHNHYDLDFEMSAGRYGLRKYVNGLFARNGIAFELTAGGRIERLPPAILGDMLSKSHFQTGDGELDSYLEDARSRFFDPDTKEHQQALKALWDAWERLKTLEIPQEGQKKQSAAALLDKAAKEEFREELEKEAQALTRIGNSFSIRHSETYQHELESSSQVDYLFYRMFALVDLLLKATGRVSRSPMRKRSGR